MIKSTLITLMEADTDITDVVSTRIFVDHVPQGKSFPCIMLTTSSVEREWSNDGACLIPTSSIEIDCFGNTYKQAIDLADEVRLLFDGYQNGTTIQGMFLSNQVDLSDNVQPGTDIRVFRVRLSFDVHYVESAS